MNKEEAEEYAKTMTYKEAVNNLKQARAIPYRKATLIKVYELAEMLDKENKGEDLYREKEQAYMQGYEDASKKYRNIPEREKGKICKDCNLCQVTDLKDWLATCNNPNSKKYLNFVKKYESCDVPEREKGEWILDETDNSVECNKCGCQIYPNDISNGEPHFCPNCGADMRGEI